MKNIEFSSPNPPQKPEELKKEDMQIIDKLKRMKADPTLAVHFDYHMDSEIDTGPFDEHGPVRSHGRR
jgi:hypothetical protein